jgi:hypothetical protein
VYYSPEVVAAAQQVSDDVYVTAGTTLLPAARPPPVSTVKYYVYINKHVLGELVIAVQHNATS